MKVFDFNTLINADIPVTGSVNSQAYNLAKHLTNRDSTCYDQHNISIWIDEYLTKNNLVITKKSDIPIDPKSIIDGIKELSI